jgi:cation diffusion facilitator family transporter
LQTSQKSQTDQVGNVSRTNQVQAESNSVNVQRERAIVRTSAIGIAANIALVIAKALVGLAAHSLAIVLDALNNLTDAASSIVTVIGIRLATKPADKEHPFGHGRIEYLSAMIVAAIVMGVGASSFIESLRKLMNPVPATYDGATLAVICLAIIVKLVLGLFFRRAGTSYKSDALVASGADALFDVLISCATLVSVLMMLIFHIDIDAYLGLGIALVIVRAGYQMFLSPLNRLLGTSQDMSIATEIQRDVADVPGVLGVYDVTLHNYGPENQMGTLNIGVKDSMSVHELGDLTHLITHMIQQRYGVNLTIGVHPVNVASPELVVMERRIASLSECYEGVKEVHGIYIDPRDKDISLDVILDFDVTSGAQTAAAIQERLKKEYPDYKVQVDIDRDYGD